MMQKLPPMEQGKTHLPGVVVNRSTDGDSKGGKKSQVEAPQGEAAPRQDGSANRTTVDSSNEKGSTSAATAGAAASMKGGEEKKDGKEEQELEAYLHRIMTGCVSSKDPEKIAAELAKNPPPSSSQGDGGLRYASVLLNDARRKNNNVMPTTRPTPSSAPAGNGGIDSPPRKKKTRYMLKARKPKKVEEMEREEEEEEEMSIIPKRKFRVVYRPKGKKGAVEDEMGAEEMKGKTFFSRTFTISGSDLNPVDLPMESMYFAKKKCEPKTVRRPKPAPAKKPEKPTYRGCLNPSFSETAPVPRHHEWCTSVHQGRRVSQPCGEKTPPSRSAMLAASLSPTPPEMSTDPLNHSEKRLGSASTGSVSTSSHRGQLRSGSGVRLEPISPAEANFAFIHQAAAEADDGAKCGGHQSPLKDLPQRLIAVATPDSTAPPPQSETRVGSPSDMENLVARGQAQESTLLGKEPESGSAVGVARSHPHAPVPPSSVFASSSTAAGSPKGFRRSLHQPAPSAASASTQYVPASRPSQPAATTQSRSGDGETALGGGGGSHSHSARRGEALNDLAQKILLDLDKAGTAEENARSARLGLSKTYEENPRFSQTLQPGSMGKSALANLIAKRQQEQQKEDEEDEKVSRIPSARFASTMPLPERGSGRGGGVDGVDGSDVPRPEAGVPRAGSPILSVTAHTTTIITEQTETTGTNSDAEQGPTTTTKPAPAPAPASASASSRTAASPISAEERRRRQVEEERRIARENAQFVQQVAPTPPPANTEAGARWHAQRAAEEKARLAALIKEEQSVVAANKEGPPAPVPEPVNPPEPEPERPTWLDDKLRESDRVLLNYDSAESKKEYRQLYVDYGHHLDGTEDGLLELWSALGGTAGWERALRPAQLSLLLSQEVTMKVRFRVGDDWLGYLGGTSIPKGEVTGFFSALLSRLPRLEFIELFDCPERPFSWSTVLQAHRPFQALKGAYFLYTAWTSTDVLQLVKLCPRIEKGKIRTDTHMQCIVGFSAEQLMDECEGKVLVRSY